MNVAIFICSYARDFRYLKWCLRSIEKFCTGYSEVRLLIPEHDKFAFREVIHGLSPQTPLNVTFFDEWPGKGFLHHAYQVMTAHNFTGADFILHMDSDCVWQEPTNVSEYFNGDKPILCHQSYESLIKIQENLRNWKIAAESALGFEVEHEFMRRHPAVHYRQLYPVAQLCIERHTKLALPEYMRRQKNDFPQTFAEFPTLGAVAWRYMHNDYHWVDLEREPRPKDKLIQFWSHAAPEEEQGTPFGGRYKPADVFRKLGL